MYLSRGLVVIMSKRTCRVLTITALNPGLKTLGAD